MDDHVSGTALLVMDVQAPMVAGLPHRDEYLQTLQSAIDVAHKKGIPVIYVVVGFRPNLTDLNRGNKALRATQDSGIVDGLIDPMPVLTPATEDVVVTKRRLGAFAGTDLEIILRTRNISHIVLAGLSTSGVVLSMLRQGVEMDYVMTVLSNLCADRDEEVHRVLTEKVFPRHAEVMSSAEWIEGLESV